MKELRVNSLLPVRLDRYLMEQFPALTPGRLNKALRENKIKLNGKKQPLSTRVQNGDVVRLYILDEKLEDKGCPSAVLVYQDEQLVIANKPAGIPVDGDGPDTLLNRVRTALKAQDQPSRAALCHRLDTGTSGLVLLARTPEAEAFLTRQIKERRITKRYLCVTFGRPIPPSAVLHDYLLKDAEKGTVKVIPSPVSGSKEIITEYETQAVSGRLALLKVTLVTMPVSCPSRKGTMSTSSGRITTSTASSGSKPESRQSNLLPKISTTLSQRIIPSTRLDSPMKSATNAFLGSL